MNFKKSIWSLINFARQLFFNPTDEVVFISRDNLSSEKIEEIRRRLGFFNPAFSNFSTRANLSFNDYLNFKAIVYVNVKNTPKILKIKKNDVFNLDYTSNYLDGWDYHYLMSKVNKDVYNEGVEQGKKLLRQLKGSDLNRYNKSYIFGTGPSLEKALERSFDDGIKIVSNTIVKDEELWLHIKPHFIVAGDAIYHFGIGKFAQKFRTDLKARMAQTNTYFVYPAHFHAFCAKEFDSFKDRLIPVPIGDKASVHHDLTFEYSLPVHGNVLLLLLLPLACTFTRDINLWGFDGRSPNDKLFWKNSAKQFYPDDVDELMQLHPLFFEKLVPKDAPESYVKKVHGDVLERVLSTAERAGFTFKMLHHTYTETLAKRV